jgi:hypothetical protein
MNGSLTVPEKYACFHHCRKRKLRGNQGEIIRRGRPS